MVADAADADQSGDSGPGDAKDAAPRPRRGGRPRSIYTWMGNKIAALALNQRELSRVLFLTQQSISGKLTGKIAVTLKDLRRLATHYNLPILYFFTPDSVTPEIARVWERAIKNQSEEVQRIVDVASTLPEPLLQELMRVTEAMSDTPGKKDG